MAIFFATAWFATAATLLFAYAPAGTEPALDSLPRDAFDAFVADDFGKFEKYLQSESQIRAWAKAEGVQLPESELNAEIQERTEQAATKAKTSFRQIRDTFAKSGFDWKQAELVEAYVLVSE